MRRRIPSLLLATSSLWMTAATCDGVTDGPLQARRERQDRSAVPVVVERPPLVGTADVEDDGALAPAGPPWPIILVHGFSGWMDFGGVEYFYNVPDDLRAAGADVTAPNLPPYDGSDERALVLAEIVDDVLARTNARKVHIIAHSQGGVDSRVLLTDLGYADRVASLYTISTPHRGTRVADLARAAPPGILNPAGQLLGWLVGSLEGPPSPDAPWLADEGVQAAFDPNLSAAVSALSTTTMAAFNDTHPDPPGVAIFSVAGVTNLLSLDQPVCRGGEWGEPGRRVDFTDFFFTAPGLYLSNTDGGTPFDPTPNDGLVTVGSARWGTFLGCIPADHPDEIGHILDTENLISGFNHKRFYRRLLEHIRERERALIASGG